MVLTLNALLSLRTASGAAGLPSSLCPTLPKLTVKNTVHLAEGSDSRLYNIQQHSNDIDINGPQDLGRHSSEWYSTRSVSTRNVSHHHIINMRRSRVKSHSHTIPGRHSVSTVKCFNVLGCFHSQHLHPKSFNRCDLQVGCMYQ